MKTGLRFIVLLAGAGVLVGCEAGKQREQILTNQQDMQDNLRKSQEREAEMLRNQDEAKKRDQEIMKIAQMGVASRKDILGIVRDNQSSLKSGGQTLEKTLQEVYGLGVDLRGAIGETRLVIEVNNDQPLRVHSAVPGDDSEIIDRLPIGSVIFQARKMTEKWWRGVIFKSGDRQEVFFAGMYTTPLREELMHEGGGSMSVGTRPMH